MTLDLAKMQRDMLQVAANKAAREMLELRILREQLFREYKPPKRTWRSRLGQLFLRAAAMLGEYHDD